MSKPGSVFSMGSGGATYEHNVQAAYLLAMLLKVETPLVTMGKISEVAFQTTSKGYATDDLLVEVDLGSGIKKKILGQIKYNVALTETNETFNEVITAFWKDFNNTKFNKSTDRLLLVKSNLTNNDKKHFNVLLDWASTHNNEIDFYKEVERIAIKKQHLNIFENLLKNANDDEDVPKKDIWKFLRCMALVGYDFTTETSTAYSNVLNIITLTKATDCTLTGSQIWNNLLALAAQYNLNGGALSYAECIQLDVYKCFDPSVFDNTFTSVSKLKEDGNIIIEPFTSSIEDFHLDRSNTLEELLEISKKHQFTIISGSAGAGKSALLKDFIETYHDKTNIFVFKAEQFNESTLSHVFTRLGVTHSISDIVNSIGFLKEKLIVIDSLEKLLEANPENAFQQFLTKIKSFKDVKVIFTSRAYAVNLILQKYYVSDVEAIEVKLMSDEELDLALLHFPNLKPYFENSGIKEILRSPKYLQFAVNTIGVSGFQVEDLSLIDFKSKLWSHIIEKSTIAGSGMARKRGKAFSNVAIKRAQSMRLFVEPDEGVDEAAIEALLDDHILYKNRNEYQFAPSHDILEDWALVKHLSKLKADAPTIEDFFNKIGSQPAFRRAFRLWVEDYLIEDTDSIVTIIRSTINNDKIEKYWTDEILVSVFRSKDASPFFKSFKADLLANNASFLGRCLMLTRTACKEYGLGSEKNKSILFPAGSVWKELLVFIAENVTELSSLRESIFSLLLDWELRFLLDSDNLSLEEIEACKSIVIHFIHQIESEDDFWLNKLSREKYKIQELVYLFFSLSSYAKPELIDFLNRANSKEGVPWRIQQFFETAIKIALGGLRNPSLIKEFPELLISLTDKNWKTQPKEEVEEIKIDGHRRISSFLPKPKPKKEESWGIENSKFDYYPSGIYKTFAAGLFSTHPVKAISFVTKFINYSVDFFMQSDYAKEHPLEKLTLKFQDGKERMQYGDLDLWIAYRGSATTVHNLIESLLMSLERYLLQLAAVDSDLAKRLLEEHCKYILQFSNNVALTSVVASVFMAHPKAFTQAILPIFRLRQFYDWDLQRSISEYHSMAPEDRQIPYAQKERMESNALPHRRKYHQGLRAFMIPYQIHYGKFNEQLFEIFDKFYKDFADDHIWIKTVTEIDVRKLKPGKVNKEAGTVELVPSYPEEISETLTAIAEDFKDNHFDASYSNLLRKAIEKEVEITFEQWLEIYTYYTAVDFQHGLFDMPVSLSKIGLDSFSTQLNEQKVSWCLDTIAKAVDALVTDKYKNDYNLSMNYSLLEKKTILHAIHLLPKYAATDEAKIDYRVLLGRLILCPLEDYDLRQFLMYFRDEFIKNCPDVASDLMKMVVSFAKFEKDNPRPYYRATKEKLVAYEKSFKNFISECMNASIEIDSEAIDFISHEKHFLIRAMLMISTKNCNTLEADYVIKVISEFVGQHTAFEGDTWRRSNQRFDYTAQTDMQLFLGQFFLYSNKVDYGQKLVDILVFPFLQEFNERDENIHDLFKFVASTLDFCITIMYDIVRDNTEEELQEYGTRFWQLWEYLFNKLKESDSYYFTDKLLLDNRFLKSLEDWKGFLSYKEQYLNMAAYFGTRKLSSVISVFSTFGEKVFLPEGLLLLKELIDEHPENTDDLMGKDGKTLIKKLFFNHISIIKNRQDLVNAFLHILGLMIDSGSTEAYLIRENVFVYKTEI
jgi:hypothetical protein